MVWLKNPLFEGGYMTTEPSKMEAVCSSETSGTTYPVTQCHILEEQIPVINPVGLGLNAECIL